MFKGIYTALITPFKNGQIDFDALSLLLERNLSAGASGFVLLGTTAEPPSLSDDEKDKILAFCTKQINGRAKIIIGVGANSTEHTLKNIEMALKYNPSALLIVTPYYNKPNLSGMIEHYSLCAKAGKPIVLYHIPSRTGQKLSHDFMAKLLKAVPQIVGIKESDYDIVGVTKTAVDFKNRIEYICGNDDLWPVFLGLQSHCLITAAGNALLPSFVKIQKLFDEGKTKESFDIFSQILPLINAAFLEVNPTCTKYMLSKLGLCSEEVRLPLGPLQEETKQKIDTLLAKSNKEFFL